MNPLSLFHYINHNLYKNTLDYFFRYETNIGTAIDRFNEVLKGLAPSAAPVLDDVNCSDSGNTAKLSFGNSQSISGYTNARPSTLSSPSSNLSDVDINGNDKYKIPSNFTKIDEFILDGIRVYEVFKRTQ